MIPRLVEARHLGAYRVWLKFSDGSAGEIDLAEELWGPVFEELRDDRRFRELFVHPELHTLAWPNGADLSPEFLRDSIKLTA